MLHNSPPIGAQLKKEKKNKPQLRVISIAAFNRLLLITEFVKFITSHLSVDILNAYTQ